MKMYWKVYLPLAPLAAVALLTLLLAAAPARAQAPPGAPAEIKGTSTTQAAGNPSRITLHGSVTMGATYNPDHPKDHINFGRLFDDRANAFLLNQMMLTLERPLDPLATSFDWGFKVQVLYGSDARYTHSLGLLDNVSDDRLQPDVIEAYANLHFPVLTKRGIDLKLGQFVTLEGAEVIDSPANFFYSHTYIFNYGIPLKHLGALATVHVNPHLDLMAGITRGVNIAFDDNNDRPAFHGGVGLNFLDGKVCVMASTHVGPENPNDEENLRYLHDITATLKLTDKLTAITDLNFARESAFDAEAYGIAQYFTYQINDWLAAGVRGEVFRDDDGFFVAQFADNDDFINLQRGELDKLNSRTVGGGPVTYGALTLGLNIRPKFAKNHLLIRPEIRYDSTIGGGAPFNDSKDKDMLTGALAITYSF